MPFFEDIGKKISNMSQSAVEKTKCSTETLRLNNQIREEQRFCKDLYQQIGQQYAKQYETNPDPAFEPLMKQLHDAQERIASYQEQIQIKKAAVAQSTTQQPVSSANNCCPSCVAPLPPDSKFCTTCGAKVEVAPPESTAPVSRVCPKCGNPLAPDALFCVSCGTKLEDTTETETETPPQEATPAPKICPKCGQQLSPDTKFCPICGEKMS